MCLFSPATNESKIEKTLLKLLVDIGAVIKLVNQNPQIVNGKNYVKENTFLSCENIISLGKLSERDNHVIEYIHVYEQWGFHHIAI